MQRRRATADACRSIARGCTIFLVPIIAFYLLFVGLQLGSGEPAFLGLFFNLALLLLMAGGFVIAWRRERLGAVLSLGALAGFLILRLVLLGIRATFSDPPLVWPFSLLVAIIKPQSFDTIPVWIVVTSWVLLAIPICLFGASWLLRREPTPPGALPADSEVSGKDATLSTPVSYSLVASVVALATSYVFLLMDLASGKYGGVHPRLLLCLGMPAALLGMLGGFSWSRVRRSPKFVPLDSVPLFLIGIVAGAIPFALVTLIPWGG